MDYRSVTNSILEVTKKSTFWESTIKFPIADNQNSLLDISLVARGERSVSPDGATKQPTHYPPVSCYMFNPDLYGENSWEKLKGMLTKVGCVSGCNPLKDKILICQNVLYQVLDMSTQYNILYHTTQYIVFNKKFIFSFKTVYIVISKKFILLSNKLQLF
jgi:hypothetical protein